MAKQDLKSSAFEGITWETGKGAEALIKVRDCVTCKGKAAVDWYYKSKTPLKRWGRGFRVGAILLTAFAGLLPMLNEIHQEREIRIRIEQATAVAPVETNLPPSAPSPSNAELATLLGSRHWLNPVWSAVFLGIAATLIGLDRFYGTTSGWVRYVLAAQQINQALEEFEIEFETQRSGWAKPDPSPEQLAAAMALSRNFLLRVNEVLQDETKAWASDFAAALKEVDEQIKVARDSNRQGAIQVVVTNGDQCPRAWKLTVGNRVSEDRVGKQASTQVMPGTYVVRAAGEINNKPVQAEKAVQVKPGEVQSVELTLA
jgi:hypothetical protein